MVLNGADYLQIFEESLPLDALKRGKNLINIWQMFNGAIDDLAMKPYIPQKNVFRDNIGIVIFDLRGHGGCWRPKTPLRGQKMHEGIDLTKKVINKKCSSTSKTP